MNLFVFEVSFVNCTNTDVVVVGDDQDHADSILRHTFGNNLISCRYLETLKSVSHNVHSMNVADLSDETLDRLFLKIHTEKAKRIDARISDYPPPLKSDLETTLINGVREYHNRNRAFPGMSLPVAKRVVETYREAKTS